MELHKRHKEYALGLLFGSFSIIWIIEYCKSSENSAWQNLFIGLFTGAFIWFVIEYVNYEKKKEDCLEKHLKLLLTLYNNTYDLLYEPKTHSTIPDLTESCHNISILISEELINSDKEEQKIIPSINKLKYIRDIFSKIAKILIDTTKEILDQENYSHPKINDIHYNLIGKNKEKINDSLKYIIIQFVDEHYKEMNWDKDYILNWLK